MDWQFHLVVPNGTDAEFLFFFYPSGQVHLLSFKSLIGKGEIILADYMPVKAVVKMKHNTSKVLHVESGT